MGPAFDFCCHEAAVYINKLIILIGPSVCRMEMCADLFSTITILHTHVYMTLVLDGGFKTWSGNTAVTF